MRTPARHFVATVLVAAMILPVAHDASAGKIKEFFKRTPGMKAAAIGGGAALAVTHPLTAPIAHGAATIAGGAVLGGAKIGGGLLLGGGHALVAAAAVSPLAGVVFAGATGYAVYKGAKFIRNKIRDRRAQKAMIASGGGGVPEGYEEVDFDEDEGFGRPMGAGAGAGAMSRRRQPTQMQDLEQDDFGADDFDQQDLREQFEDNAGLGGFEGEGDDFERPGALGGPPPAPPEVMNRPAGPVAGPGPAPLVGAPAAAAATPASRLARAPRQVGAAVPSKSGKSMQTEYALANGNRVTKSVWGKPGKEQARVTERDAAGNQISSVGGKAEKFAGLPGATAIKSSTTKSGGTREEMQLEDGSKVRVTQWNQGKTPMIYITHLDPAGKPIPGTSFKGSVAKYEAQLAAEGAQ